jgi:hypothetical protein
MRLYEYRQSATSPLKYHLEFSPEEFKMTKELVMDIVEKIETDKKNEALQAKAWIEVHEDIVEWMTEPTKFPPRSDCG